MVIVYYFILQHTKKNHKSPTKCHFVGGVRRQALLHDVFWTLRDDIVNGGLSQKAPATPQHDICRRNYLYDII